MSEVQEISNRLRESKRAKRRRDREDAAVVLGTKQGRRFVWNLLAKAGMFQLGWYGEQSQHSSFAAGARNVALNLWMDLVKNHNDAAKQMLLENMEAQDGRIDSLNAGTDGRDDDGSDEGRGD